MQEQEQKQENQSSKNDGCTTVVGIISFIVGIIVVIFAISVFFST